MKNVIIAIIYNICKCANLAKNAVINKINVNLTIVN